MSQFIVREADFFLHSFLCGIVITLSYDGFLILRRVFRHSNLLVSLEDIIFWMGCAIGVFNMLYEENNGVLRWFAVLSATLGMLIYKKSISKLIVNIMSTVISKIIYLTIKFIRLITKPVRAGSVVIYRKYKQITKKLHRIRKYVKIRLTNGIKVLKITLCKH